MISLRWDAASRAGLSTSVKYQPQNRSSGRDQCSPFMMSPTLPIVWAISSGTAAMSMNLPIWTLAR